MDYESIRSYTRIITKVAIYLMFALFLYIIYKVHLKKEKPAKPIIKTITLMIYLFLIIPALLIGLIILFGFIITLTMGKPSLPLGILIIFIIMVAILIFGIWGLKMVKKRLGDPKN